MDPTYTIAVANRNMEATLRESLESILSQVDTSTYEVVVIDDSTDRSPEILRNLADTWENLRVYTDCGNANLAEARNMSFEKARGKYVFASLDTDNVYEPIIEDYATIYHALEQGIDNPFFLSGTGMNMAPRELLLDVPYRSLGYGEDRDYWRQLAARGAYVGFHHDSIDTQIGYERSVRNKFHVGLETITVQFQSGVTLPSYIRWALAELTAARTRPRTRALAHVVLAPIAWLRARTREPYDAPTPFEDMSVWRAHLVEQTGTLSELEAQYAISIDRSSLSERGRTLLDVEENTFSI